MVNVSGSIISMTCRRRSDGPYNSDRTMSAMRHKENTMHSCQLIMLKFVRCESTGEGTKDKENPLSLTPSVPIHPLVPS